MPTFTIEIREKNERRDGKFPVSIRLTHKRSSANISTGLYVVRRQVKSDFSGIKDNFILRSLLNDIDKYEEMLTKGLGTDLSRFSARDLVRYIEMQKVTAGGVGIDFISFANTHINALRDCGRKGSAERFDAVVRNLIDYFGRPTQGETKLETETVGEKDCKGYNNKLTGNYPDINDEAVAWANDNVNANSIFIAQHFTAGGAPRWVVIGGQHYDPEVTIKADSGAKMGDKKGLAIEVTAGDSRMLPRYTGIVKLADGTYDCATNVFTPKP